MSPSRALLAAVERSPSACAAHDRSAWVDVFTVDGQVEDPVGSHPHIGYSQIYRFYDTFIGPRDITFHRNLDIVAATSVLRDVELEVRMGPGVTMMVPAFLRYDLREVDGEWKIARLRAYWELPAMIAQFLGCGRRALAPGLALSRGLLANQGFGGAAGFLRGFRRVGNRQKSLVDGFLTALACGDPAAASRLLTPSAVVTLGDDEPLDLLHLVGRLRGARWPKMIGAGPTVAVGLSCRPGRGMLFADVAGRGDRITRVRYFPA